MQRRNCFEHLSYKPNEPAGELVDMAGKSQHERLRSHSDDKDYGKQIAQSQRLPHGLYNQGATCYLNSVLQVLSMTTKIHDRLNPKSNRTDDCLSNIFKELKKDTCGTETITAVLGINNVREQGDAAECLERILCQISQQASGVFQGELQYTIKCSKKDHSINTQKNLFWSLPLSLKDTHDINYSVKRSFERIFQQKSFSGDNMVYCNECKKKTEANSGCEMVKYPQILILLLKRFDFDYRTMSYFKSDRSVDVPRTLQRKDKEYELYGMVNHTGSLRGGHYTATILCSEDKTWFEFNDDHVSKIKQQPFAETSTYKSMTAYLLMYRAISESLTDDAQPNQDETRKLNDLKPDHGKIKRSGGERETDDEKKRKIGQTEGDDVQKKIHEASGHEAGGEEDAAPAAPKRGPQEMLAALSGNAAPAAPKRGPHEMLAALLAKTGSKTLRVQPRGSCADIVRTEKLARRKSDYGAPSKLINSGIEEAKNTNKSDELRQTKVDDAPVNVGEEQTDLCEQHLDEETEKQKQTDAAQKRGQSGSNKKSSRKRFKGKKSSGTDDAAEQDKTSNVDKRMQDEMLHKRGDNLARKKNHHVTLSAV